MSTVRAPEEAFWRFDYFKFTFQDADHKFSNQRFNAVLKATAEVMVDVPHGSYREPKQTFLAPGPTRPNGLQIIEMWGKAAETLMRLPWGWVEYLTHVHVKTYADLPEGMSYKQMLEVFDEPGYRKSTRITPRRQRHSKKDSGLPGLQIGSKKSDLHFGIYARPGERIGLEGRFRDERMMNLRDTAIVAGNPVEGRGGRGWVVLLALCGRQAREQLEYELLSRAVEMEELYVNLGRVPVSHWSQRFHFPAPGQTSIVEPDDDNDDGE